MATIAGLLLTIGLLLTAVSKGVYLGYPLAVGYLYFCCYYLLRGRKAGDIYAMSREGAQKAFIVIPVLLLIGCLVALWLAAGTVAVCVYYSLALIKPGLFILFAFVLPSIISLLLGTAFGTVGTIGVILMALARAGEVNPYVAAGAIISGIYVGDRCSPMSSAAYLLSSVTKTDPFETIRMCLKTTLLPYGLTLGLFLIFSLLNPLSTGDFSLREDLRQSFNLGFLAFIPAIVLLLLACLRIKVRLSMLASAICALLLALFMQGWGLFELFGFVLFGFQLPEGHPLAAIIRGGGVWSMLKTSFILLAACSLTGLLERAGALDGLEKLLEKPCGRGRLYLKTTAVALLALACGCNQSIGIVLSGELMSRPYLQNGLTRQDLARDISFTAIPLAGIVPWSVASRVPLDALGLTGVAHWPYMFYLFMVPLVYGLIYAWQSRAQKNQTRAN